MRASLWFWPMVAAVLSLVLTVALIQVRPEPGSALAQWTWPGDAESASAMLQTVATAVMTAAALTFTLTVVALQLASQQFSPRLLREFARDRLIQVVLAVLVSTFVVALTGLRGISVDLPLPVLVIALALLLGVGSAGALLGFLGHIVRELRVDTMMVAVHKDTIQTIRKSYPEYGDLSKVPRADLPRQGGGHVLTFRDGGFVQVIHPDVLVRAAKAHGAFVRLELRPGDHIVEGIPAAIAWLADGEGELQIEGLEKALNKAVEAGFERTTEQDAAFGLRQLTDIALKAISPGINDPVTAVHAVGHLTDLLRRLQDRHLGEQQHDDDDGVPRLVTGDRDHRYYLDLVCAPIRQYGRSQPLVLNALLRLLRDCAATAKDDRQRTEIGRQQRLILAEVSDELLDDDAGGVRDLGERVTLALAGNLRDAYGDRSGETKSV